MFALTDIINGLTTELGGAVILAILAVVWKLRTPEVRQECRAALIRRITVLRAEARELLWRWEILPFTLSVIPVIFLEDKGIAAVAAQGVFATVLLAYAFVAVRNVVNRFR